MSYTVNGRHDRISECRIQCQSHGQTLNLAASLMASLSLRLGLSSVRLSLAVAVQAPVSVPL